MKMILTLILTLINIASIGFWLYQRGRSNILREILANFKEIVEINQRHLSRIIELEEKLKKYERENI